MSARLPNLGTSQPALASQRPDDVAPIFPTTRRETPAVPALTVVDGKPMADSREVARHFGKQHKHVLEAIRECHCSAEFRRSHFRPFKIRDLTGESTSHVLMDRSAFAFVVLGFTGAAAGVFREAYIDRFDAMEAELRGNLVDNIHEVPQTLPQALRLAADLADRVEAQAAAIAVLEPRSEALAVIADADGTCCVTDAAKALQVTPSDLWAYLYREQWTYRRDRDGVAVAYQSKITAGHLTMKVVAVPTGDGRTWAKHQVRVTAKGLTTLAQRIPLDRPPGLLSVPRAGTVPALPSNQGGR